MQAFLRCWVTHTVITSFRQTGAFRTSLVAFTLSIHARGAYDMKTGHGYNVVPACMATVALWETTEFLVFSWNIGTKVSGPRSRRAKILSVTWRLFSYPSVKTCVLGAQKNRLIETVLSRTHNICFGCEIRKMNCNYALLSRGLISLTLYSLHAGVIFHAFVVDCRLFFLQKIFQVHYQSVKRVGSRSGSAFCRSWSGSKLFAKFIIEHTTSSPLAREGLSTPMLA